MQVKNYIVATDVFVGSTPGSAPSADSLTGVTQTYTNGRLTGLNLGSNYGVSYSYDTYGRFETINAQIAGTGTQTYTYSYLPDSDRTQQLNMVTLSGVEGLVTRAYEPHRNVLTQVKNQFGTDVISQYDYVNDELVQRTSMTTSGTAFDSAPPPAISPHETSYTTNELNQYTEITVENGGSQTIGLTYDLDGNLTNDGTLQYAYDTENRLISATPLNPQNGDKKTEYVYDYMSRRVQRNVYVYDTGSWALDMEKSFVYDGWNLI